jgi:hypothetical protein
MVRLHRAAVGSAERSLFQPLIVERLHPSRGGDPMTPEDPYRTIHPVPFGAGPRSALPLSATVAAFVSASAVESLVAATSIRAAARPPSLAEDRRSFA